MSKPITVGALYCPLIIPKLDASQIRAALRKKETGR